MTKAKCVEAKLAKTKLAMATFAKVQFAEAKFPKGTFATFAIAEWAKATCPHTIRSLMPFQKDTISKAENTKYHEDTNVR